MLLFSIYRMYRTSAVHIIITIIFSALIVINHAFADTQSGKSKNKQPTVKQDLLTDGKNKHDILTAPQNQRKPSKSASATKKADKKTDFAATSAPSPNVMQPGKTVKPDKNIDVYIGRCPYAVEGVKEAKKFLAHHKDYYGQYFMMKTDSDYEVKPSDLSGIEVYLPLEAEKYNVVNVPAFVINVNGHMYKVSGTVDLEEVYKEIVSGKAKGERKDAYIDLGVRGKICKAIIVNLAPKKTLNEQEKRAVIRDAGRPPNFTVLLHQRKIVFPESSTPMVVEKQVAVPHHGIPRYIVFSKDQKKWALEMSKKGAMGCCTDCIDIGDISHFAQLCTKELLTEFNVKSTPAIVNISAKK